MRKSVAAINFCANIKRLREENFFSMELMAEFCGVDVHTLEKIERGNLTIELALTVTANIHSSLFVCPYAMLSENVLTYDWITT